MILTRSFAADHLVDRRAVFGLDRGPLSPALIAAAVALGRMPGEPGRLIEPTRLRGWFNTLIGWRWTTPLADPRLEVLRAISASLVKRPSAIPAKLVAAADRMGWTLHDLRRLFPATSMGSPA